MGTRFLSPTTSKSSVSQGFSETLVYETVRSTLTEDSYHPVIHKLPFPKDVIERMKRTDLVD